MEGDFVEAAGLATFIPGSLRHERRVPEDIRQRVEALLRDHPTAESLTTRTAKPQPVKVTKSSHVYFSSNTIVVRCTFYVDVTRWDDPDYVEALGKEVAAATQVFMDAREWESK